ncbi:hypothetical protein TNCV_3038131 [Trichonephila clavipes]|nr:hypothetical protein TNCV_3038131 [Trichonephila clavipes]
MERSYLFFSGSLVARTYDVSNEENFDSTDFTSSQNVWKKKLCLQEALDLLQNPLSEINDVLTDDFSDEEVSQKIIC